MRLYESSVSGNCYKVRLLAAQLGLELERVELSVIDRSDREAVLGGKNPGLRVPTLELDDGRTLGESDAILWFLADGTPLVPDEPFERAQVLQWCFFEQYSHEPFVAVARFWVAILGRYDEDALAERQQGAHTALRAMERHLADRSYLVGERYSIADIALYAYTHVAPEGGIDLDAYPAVRRWLARVAAQPGHVAITA
jgi:glutathione S-transferase